MDQNNNTVQASSPSTEWPGAWSVYKPSRDAVRKNLGTIILLIVANIAIVYILSFVFQLVLGKTSGALLSELVAWIVDAFLLSATIYAYLSGVRGKRVELNEALKFAQPKWLRMFLLQILITLTVFGGFILLVVPGVIFALRLSLASYYLVDQDLGVMDAYKASWHATKGNLGKIWGLIGVNFVFLMLCIVLVGIYFSIMFSASFALLYVYISSKQPAAQAKPEVVA